MNYTISEYWTNLRIQYVQLYKKKKIQILHGSCTRYAQLI